MMRRSLAVAVASAVAFAASPAAAQYAGNELSGATPKHFESPQHVALELRFSPYQPNIDSAPGVSGAPYQSVFGTMPRLLGSLEVDWQALRIPYLGTLGLGGSVGYTSMSALAPFSAGSGRSGLSGETTSLDVFPMYAVVVLRADVLLRNWKFPIVPYGKAGVGMALWRAYNDAGTSSYTDASGHGVSGKGYTLGTQFAAGLALSINWLDPRAARALDNGTGINNTSLFAEWMVSKLDGFGSTKALYVGSSTWVAGLSFEF